MPLPDNRIRYPAAKIDFATDFGLTGQDHDTYPPEGGQARFDHMRATLIGLLANQSSYTEPTQFCEGTIWFDLNLLCLKVRRSNAWQDLAQAIQLDTVGETPLTLATWYASASAVLNSFSADITFSGHSASDGVIDIPIPESLRPLLLTNSRPLVFVNGALLDPRKSTLFGSPVATTVRLIGGTVLSADDEFTVIIRSIPDANFYTPNVVAT